MRSKNILGLIIPAVMAGPVHAKYEAHEWGTFTSVVGSNGFTQNGMYHEDELLPNFVHGFGELRFEAAPPSSPVTPMPPTSPSRPCHSKICFGFDELQQNAITQKMETPVIYFYSDVAREVQVNVKFPQGIITETYPGPVKTFPTLADPHVVGGGESTFSLKVLTTSEAALENVDAGNIYSHARGVASNVIESGAEKEKFLFYRGLGRFQPSFLMTSERGQLKFANLSEARPLAAFLVDVDASGNSQLMELPQMRTANAFTLSASEIGKFRDHAHPLPSIFRGIDAKSRLISSLVQAGLNGDEALAMLNTWENGYLKVPGLRLLYILPKAEVDSVLPLSITPMPDKLVRVFVGRMEILLDTQEKDFLQQILRDQSRFDVKKLGRFSEPILSRLREIAEKSGQNQDLIPVFNQLMKAIFNAESPTGAVH